MRARTSTLAGRARKRDIDFATLLEPVRKEAAEFWERAQQAVAGLRWQALAEIEQSCMSASDARAEPDVLFDRWRSQAAVQAIAQAMNGAAPGNAWLKWNWRTPGTRSVDRFAASVVDAFRLARPDYLQSFGMSSVVAVSHCLCDGNLHEGLSRVERDALVEAAPDDAWVTVAQVHA